ncbi:MAG: C25 family peptidase propeptide domain-containing protein [Leptospirillia bacterium]
MSLLHVVVAVSIRDMFKLLGCLLLSVLPATAYAESPVRVIASDPGGTVLELLIQDPQITDAGQGYVSVSLPEFQSIARPGDPALPVTGVLVGIPEGGRFSYEVIVAEYREIDGLRPAPAPTVASGPGETLVPVLLEGDPYLDTVLFPPATVQEGTSGAIRNQEVAQLLFHPVLFDPVRDTLRIYTRIQVMVRFAMNDGVLTKATLPWDGGMLTGRPFESLLSGTLVNYPALER